MGQDFQIRLVIGRGLCGFSGFFLTLCQSEICYGVVGFVNQSFLVAFQRGAVVFPLVVEVADLDILGRFVRVPSLKFLNVASRVSSVHNCGTALGMLLGIIGRRAEIDACVFAGTQFGLARGGAVFLLAFLRGRWLVLLCKD